MIFNLENWNLNEFEHWLQVDSEKLSKFNFDENTNRCLQNGIPKMAAPYLSFYSEKDILKLRYLNDFLNIDFENGNNIVVIGSDANGNLICIDKSDNDKVMLLELDNNLKLSTVNENMSDFLDSILVYREFAKSIIEKFGDDALFDFQYSLEDIENLQFEMMKINKSLIEKSDFWRNEIDLLMANKNSLK